jgi:hypothetical protein
MIAIVAVSSERLLRIDASILMIAFRMVYLAFP